MKINLSYKQDIVGSSKDATTVIESWGLVRNKTHNICNIDLKIEDNKIYYICGYSGSGKSSILREIHKQTKGAVYIENYKLYLNALEQDKLMIDFYDDIDYNRRLKILGKCGLTEVWKYITKIKDLSDGEKFRFMLYHNIMRILSEKKEAVLIVDEFCSTLDRITAKVVSQNIHKLRDLLIKEGITITFILASAHDDLIPFLSADYNFFKEFQPELNLLLMGDKKVIETL